MKAPLRWPPAPLPGPPRGGYRDPQPTAEDEEIRALRHDVARLEWELERAREREAHARTGPLAAVGLALFGACCVTAALIEALT